MRYLRILQFLVVLAAVGLYGAYGQNENFVTTLTDANYVNHIQSGAWFVMFYAPWCGHCQRFKPTWTKLAEELQGDVNVAWVDCEKEKYLQDLFAIQSFPSLIFLKDGRMYEYNQDRSPDRLKAFVREDYKNAESEKIPKVPSVIKPFMKAMRSMKNQIVAMVVAEPATAAIVITAIVVIFGFMMLVCCWLLQPEKPADTKQPDQKTKKVKTN